MGSLHPRVAGSIQQIGACIDRRVAMIGGDVGGDEDEELQELLDRIDAEVSDLCTARALWPEDELVRDVLARLARCHSETIWWRAQGCPGDGADYVPSDAYYDAIQDLFWATGADAHAAAVAAYRGRTMRCSSRHASDRRLTVTALLDETRTIVERLGDAPWERDSNGDADAVRRLSLLGAMLHDAAHEPSLRRETRVAIRRVAGTLWSLEHVRINEVRQVWGEVQRACEVLRPEEDQSCGKVIDLATRRSS